MYEFDDEVLAEVQDSRQLSPFSTALGFPAGIGWHKCVTQTIYHFLEQDAPKFKQEQGIYTGFKPTTTKNYPSQGLGGLIMQVACGRIFRWLALNDFFNGKVRIINTVHDCIWVDCHKDIAGLVAYHIKLIMENTKHYFNKFYKTNWKLDFPIEIEAGSNMLNLYTYNPENYEVPDTDYFTPTLYYTEED